MKRFTLFFFVMVVVLCCISSCTTTKYVPVVETHTDHHWHTDSVRQRDSTHTERETVIRELDSAAMARYGIQMKANQWAWLVLQREMENRLRELERMTAQRDTVRDSIPVPYPVVKYVERKMSGIDKFLIATGIFFIISILIFVAYKLRRFLPFW